MNHRRPLVTEADIRVAQARRRLLWDQLTVEQANPDADPDRLRDLDDEWDAVNFYIQEYGGRR